jgi:hypothetical protein
MSKVKFKCKNCNKIDEFEKEGQTQLLVEMDKVIKDDIYIVYCSHCGYQNRIIVGGL